MRHVYFQDSNQHLWIGADNEGIYELDAEGGCLRHYQPGSSSHSVANTIMCIYEDSEKNLWLGSYTRGIAKLNRKPEYVITLCLSTMKRYFL